MKFSPGLALLLIAMVLGACGKKDAAADKPKAPPATIITTTTAQTRSLEIHEDTVGSVEGLIDPTVAAEVAARVVKVLVHVGDTVRIGQPIAELDAEDIRLQRREAQAEIARIEALLANQGKVVERNRQLVGRNFISQNALDEATTQQDALREQLEGARARLAAIDHNGSKTHVVSPLDGRVEKQIVSVGDYVKVGDPLYQIIGTRRLRAHLPYPESVASRLKPGLPVRLISPVAPDLVVTTTIKDIKPLIGSTNRAADVIADVIDQPGWQPGSSVNGVVVLGQHAQSVVIPEQSVVLRPAGEAAYAIREGHAYQRIVKTGLRQEGVVEIVDGLSAGETVAADGAAYLTDKTAVTVTNPQSAGKAP